MDGLSFPLYHGFFPQLVLSVDELLAYRRLGKERVSQLVRIVEDADCVYSWADVKRDGKSHGAKVQRATFVDVRPDSKAAQPSMLLKASVHIVDVQAEEVLAALAHSKTKDFRKTMAYMHGASFVDAQTLLTFPTSVNSVKPPYSYRAIKWCALKKSSARDATSSKKLLKKAQAQAPTTLDFCFLEYAGRKKARPGSTVLGFIVQESMAPEREAPRLESFDITRAPLTRSGIIVSRTHQSNILKVTAICQIDGAVEPALRTAMEAILTESVASIQRVKGLLERQRMGKLQYLEEWEWVATSDRKACAVCLRGFYFHRKHHCQTCGEVVCSSCAPLRELDEPLFDATQIRVCTACLAGAGSQGAASTERTSSNDATEAYMRDLQHPPRATVLETQSLQDTSLGGRHRPARVSEESSSDDSGDVRRQLPVSRLRTSELSFGGPGRAARNSSRASSLAQTEALNKLAYHMQQIRETINVAVSEVDQSNTQSCDDVYDKIMQIRETLDISSNEFEAVLAAIGGGSGGSRSGARSDPGDSVDGSFEYSDDTGSELNVSYSYSSSSARSSLSRFDNEGDDSLMYPDSRRSSSLSRYSSLPRSSMPLSSHRRSSVPRSSQWRSSLSQSSHGSDDDDEDSLDRFAATTAAAARDSRGSELYYYHSSISSPSVYDHRQSSPAHKDSLFSDQTVASSASKQSSDGKQARDAAQAHDHDDEHGSERSHSRHHHHEHLDHVLKINNARGIHRLAQKIEKLQQRLEDSRRAASVVSSSDLELEPEPEVASRASSRDRRISFVETTPRAASSVASASPARRMSSPHDEMVLALRGVMESSELTQAPPAWRKSFSSAHTPSSAASSSSSRHSRSSSAAGRRGARSRTSHSSSTGSGVLVGLPPSGRSQRPDDSESATMFVYDEDSVNKFQRLNIEKRSGAAPEYDGHGASDDEDDDGLDEEFSISSSEDGHAFASLEHSLAHGRDRDGGRLRLYPSPSPSAHSLGASEEGDDNVASLPTSHDLLYASAKTQPQQQPQQQQLAQVQPSPQQKQLVGADERESIEATRRLIEDVNKLPARMRTSSGQSSGAPSQESHDF